MKPHLVEQLAYLRKLAAFPLTTRRTYAPARALIRDRLASASGCRKAGYQFVSITAEGRRLLADIDATFPTLAEAA